MEKDFLVLSKFYNHNIIVVLIKIQAERNIQLTSWKTIERIGANNREKKGPSVWMWI